MKDVRLGHVVSGVQLPAEGGVEVQLTEEEEEEEEEGSEEENEEPSSE